MSEQKIFHIGDAVVMQHATYYEEFNDCIGVIVGELRTRRATDMRTMERTVVSAYSVQLQPGFTVVAKPYQLRRLRGPEEPESVHSEQDTPEEVRA